MIDDVGTPPLRVLHLEDSDLDHELAMVHLRRAGLRVRSHRIDSRAEFERELQGQWDLILSDYNLPGFTGLQALELLRASGRFLSAQPISRARDLVGLQLLQLESRPDAWARWFAHHGVPGPVPQGMVFDQFAPMIQAVIHGLGVALLPEFLAKPELADGRLVRAFGEPVAGTEGYYLVWPATGASYPPLLAFRD